MAERYAANPQYSATLPMQELPCVPPGVQILDRSILNLQKELGEGCFGKVYEGRPCWLIDWFITLQLLSAYRIIVFWLILLLMLLRLARYTEGSVVLTGVFLILASMCVRWERRKYFASFWFYCPHKARLLFHICNKKWNHTNQKAATHCVPKQQMTFVCSKKALFLSLGQRADNVFALAEFISKDESAAGHAVSHFVCKTHAACSPGLFDRT